MVTTLIPKILSLSHSDATGEATPPPLSPLLFCVDSPLITRFTVTRAPPTISSVALKFAARRFSALRNDLRFLFIIFLGKSANFCSEDSRCSRQAHSSSGWRALNHLLRRTVQLLRDHAAASSLADGCWMRGRHRQNPFDALWMLQVF